MPTTIQHILPSAAALAILAHTLLALFFRMHTPAEWVAFAERQPRLARFIRPGSGVEHLVVEALKALEERVVVPVATAAPSSYGVTTALLGAAIDPSGGIPIAAIRPAGVQVTAFTPADAVTAPSLPDVGRTIYVSPTGPAIAAAPQATAAPEAARAAVLATLDAPDDATPPDPRVAEIEKAGGVEVFAVPGAGESGR